MYRWSRWSPGTGDKIGTSWTVGGRPPIRPISAPAGSGHATHRNMERCNTQRPKQWVVTVQITCRAGEPRPARMADYRPPGSRSAAAISATGARVRRGAG